MEKYEQKRGRYNISILIRERCIEYQFRDSLNKKSEEKQIRFEDITNNKHTDLEPVNLEVTIGLLIASIANYFTSLFIKETALRMAIGCCLVILILVFMLVYSGAVIKIIIALGDIKIVRDKQSANIIKAIYANRNEFLREKYGSINWENDIKNEIGKFNWLADLGVITESELKEKISNLKTK
jgi:hypothetical protein